MTLQTAAGVKILVNDTKATDARQNATPNHKEEEAKSKVTKTQIQNEVCDGCLTTSNCPFEKGFCCIQFPKLTKYHVHQPFAEESAPPSPQAPSHRCQPASFAGWPCTANIHRFIMGMSFFLLLLVFGLDSLPSSHVKPAFPDGNKTTNKSKHKSKHFNPSKAPQPATGNILLQH